MTATLTRPPLSFGCCTDMGRMRKHNEDACHIATGPSETAMTSKGILMLVADGVGGLDAGDVASTTAVKAATEAYYADTEAGIGAALFYAMQFAHEAVRRAAVQSGNVSMATTLVMAVIHGGELTVVNVGDSRAYLLRAGDLKQLSIDHSLVAAQMRQGLLTEAEAHDHAHRNVLTRALGVPQATVDPDIITIAWQDEDRLLLCSDGLWGSLDESHIVQLLSAGSPQVAAASLVKAANTVGGSDNITALVVAVQIAKSADLKVSLLQAVAKAPRNFLIGGIGILIGMLVGGIFVWATVSKVPPSGAVTDATYAPTLPPPPTTATSTLAVPLIVATALPTTSMALSTVAVQEMPSSTTVTPISEATATLAPLPQKGLAFCSRLRTTTCIKNSSVFSRRTRSLFVTWDKRSINTSQAFEVHWTNGALIDATASLRCTFNETRTRCAENEIAPSWAHLAGLAPGRYTVQLVTAGQIVLSGEFQIAE